MRLLTNDSLFSFYDMNNIAVRHDLYQQYREYTTLGVIIGNKLVGIEHQLSDIKEIQELGDKLKKILNKENKMSKFYFVKPFLSKIYAVKNRPVFVNEIIKPYMPKTDKCSSHVFKLTNHKKVHAYLFFICGGYNPFNITLDVVNMCNKQLIEAYPIFR